MAASLSEQDWQIRQYIYESFVEHGQPPPHTDAARHFAIRADRACAAYHRLHDAHALLLEPGADSVRIANPLSAVPTAYRVLVNGRALYANCAWDSLGVPSMLHADAMIEAMYAHTGAPVTYAVVDGELRDPGGLVHFPLPFKRWYDNLIHT